LTSLFDELNDKVRKDPRLTKLNMARADLGLLLFNARDTICELWKAAEAEVATATREGRNAPLAAAVEKLRPIFGERRSASSRRTKS